MAGSIFSAVLLTLFLSTIAFGLGKVVASIGINPIENERTVDLRREMLARRARLEAALEARRKALVVELRDLNRWNQDLTAQKADLTDKVEDAEAIGDQLVRLVGEETTTAQKFHALVLNKYVNSTKASERQHALIDAAWAQPQSIEVWAESQNDARSQVEKRYPAAFGYVIQLLTQIVDTGGGQPSPSKA